MGQQLQGTMVRTGRHSLCVSFTILSLQSINLLVSGKRLDNSFLGNMIDDITNNIHEYGGLDYGQMMDEEDNHQPERQEGSTAKAHLKGGVLPAYCDPPNPCPKGYTAEDGCIEMDDFQNKAEFSRKYQASQSCMCDSEHMFSCPDMYHQEDDMPLFGVSNFEDINNPFLSGAKLPIAAKKGMGY